MDKDNVSLDQIKLAQEITEQKNASKFSLAREKIGEIKETKVKKKLRQISCTIESSDFELLTELSSHFTLKKGKILNSSAIMRALIRLGHKSKDALEAEIL